MPSPSSFSRRSALALIGGAGATALLWPPAACAQLRSSGRDSAHALQQAIAEAAARGGGEVRLPARATTIVSAAPVILDNVTLDLNGGTLVLELSGHNDTGVRLRSGATLRNGTILVRSSGRPSLQGAVHAPVVVGPLYGEGGTPRRRSPDEGVGSWTIRDLVLSTDKDADAGGYRIGAPAIQVMGGAHRGLIENIEVPDSPYMAGGVHLDWAVVGPITSPTIAANAVHYRRDEAYTTHPNQIEIRNIRVGRLTRPHGPVEGTSGIRLSGVHDVSVSDVLVAGVTGAAFRHTAGDLGFEFAQAAVKPRACRGIRIVGARVIDAMTGHLIHSDSYADNVGRAAERGYRPMMEPIHSTDILFERIEGAERAGRSPNYGIRVNHQKGGRIVDCTARGYRRGFYVDEQVDGLALVRPVAIDNEDHGISVEHPSRPPRNIRIESPTARGNGRRPESGIPGGVYVGRSDNVEIVGGTAARGGGQLAGIRLAREARGARVSGVAESLVSRD